MVRTKVKLQYISSDAARRISLKNRQRSLLKKVREISVLCGVDACCIVHNPEEPTKPPQVYPPQQEDARRILGTFYSLPEKERTRRMTNHLAFMEERVATLQKRLAKYSSENDRLEALANLYKGIAMQEFDGLDASELSAVGELLDEFIDKIYSRLSLMTCPPDAQDDERATGTAGKSAVVGQIVAPAVTAPAVTAPAATASAEAGPSNQAKQGGEFSAEESGCDESSDDETELGDTDDDDDE